MSVVLVDINHTPPIALPLRSEGNPMHDLLLFDSAEEACGILHSYLSELLPDQGALLDTRYIKETLAGCINFLEMAWINHSIPDGGRQNHLLVWEFFQNVPIDQLISKTLFSAPGSKLAIDYLHYRIGNHYDMNYVYDDDFLKLALLSSLEPFKDLIPMFLRRRVKQEPAELYTLKSDPALLQHHPEEPCGVAIQLFGSTENTLVFSHTPSDTEGQEATLNLTLEEDQVSATLPIDETYPPIYVLHDWITTIVENPDTSIDEITNRFLLGFRTSLTSNINHEGRSEYYRLLQQVDKRMKFHLTELNNKVERSTDDLLYLMKFVRTIYNMTLHLLPEEHRIHINPQSVLDIETTKTMAAELLTHVS
ncbi:hypothetical protein KC717_05040 [Candidatus Dojkabacteria bacterium]|uniref:Uncharacterized protein n=1 Tax=Candidatus Dojkabacteria bacterium TaxID=2099670 RepID=A0A955L8I6_9BACT|nr:hypothetical protein [Candidatus Dojkabacteria bacterium]